MTMTSQFVDMTSSPHFSDIVLFLLSILVTGASFMSISLLVLELWKFSFKALTRNPEFGNTPVWILPNIWRLGQVTDTEFGTIVCNKMIVNAAKCQVYSFYRFWVIKGKPTVVKITPTRTLRNYPVHLVFKWIKELKVLKEEKLIDLLVLAIFSVLCCKAKNNYNYKFLI